MKKLNSFTINTVKEDLTTEDVMLDFLDAISNIYKNCMMLKGCMCLKLQLGLNKDIRGTRDLDMHFFTSEDWEDFVVNCCAVANKYSKLGISYELIKRRGREKNPHSDSLTFAAKLPNGLSELFKLDMNIGNIHNKEKFELDENNIFIDSTYGILLDKLKVISTIKVCRRVKDLVDVYYLALSEAYNFEELVKSLDDSLIEQLVTSEIYCLNPDNYLDIEHAYEKYNFVKGTKPELRDVLNVVYEFIYPIIYYLRSKHGMKSTWNKEGLRWI